MPDRELVPNEQQIIEMYQKIQQNAAEDAAFSEKLDSLIAGSLPVHEVVTVGRTPNVLKLVGSEADNLMVNQGVLRNCMNSEDVVVSRHTSGHNLPLNLMKEIPKAIRNPIMICRGAENNPSSVVVVTELKNNEEQNVIVPIAIDVQKGGSVINNILSAYGKENIQAIITRGILAVNEEKARELGWNIEAVSSQFALIPCFDNSISYSMANVKYPDENSRNVFVLTDDMTMTDVMRKYYELEMQVLSYDALRPNFPTAEERQILAEYAEVKSFITDVAYGIDFTAGSTAMVFTEDGIKPMGMLTAEQYAENMADLTDGNNRDFINAVRYIQYRDVPLDEHLSRAETINNIVERLNEGTAILNNADNHRRTVGEVKEALARVENQMKEFGISKENAYEEIDLKLMEMQERGQLIEIETIDIVESIDGYVMNTSETVTAEKSAELAIENNVVNGNEVHHNMPQETTNSSADIRPNIQLEQVSSIGSKERAEIASGYGTDSDIDRLAQQSEVYETQSDKPAKSKKKQTEYNDD
ncbi:MAG: hypothetical protein NC489_31885 [Ruminococcus flavefaciens]|nr:hypothetical protein [Ruminococcus flavefaciens]